MTLVICALLLSSMNVSSLAASGDFDLHSDMDQMEQSNMDSALKWAKSDRDKTTGLIAALMAASHDDFQTAAYFLPQPRQGAKDPLSDNPADQLSLAVDMVEQKAQAYQRQAALVPIAPAKASPQELVIKRSGYHMQEREQDLQHAESDLAKALKKAKQSRVALSPDASQLISILKSYWTEVRHGADAAAALAGQVPSANAKKILKALEQDASDLKREARLLEIYLTLEKIGDLLFQSAGR